ncbi:MAG: adenylate/guanylate cyclase domain-containing protein, partial [Gammaproteobacteria bacterium]|nr:adenylate/guanylate cyclase domain-containing protein [Gammaproteobacteria bacterium]
QYRRAPLLQLYEGGMYPSLALAVVRTALGNAGININVQDNRQGYTAIEQVQVGSLLIPVDQHGSVVVPYRGLQGSFPYFSIIDLMNKNVPVEALQDSIVLVGTTAPGLLDLRATPVASAFAGVEVHANIISGILDQRIPLQPAWVIALEMTLLVLLGAAVMIVPRWLSPGQIIMFLVGLTALVIYGSFAAWNNGLILPLASPVLLILSIYLVHMSWGFLVENSAKRAITRLFGSYVPPDLVDEMADNPDDVGFEGQAREMTVLFSDVRGFTSISEGFEPKELCKLMNELLTPMTRVIHGNRGTIDKYMGDCIMAFWGAPMRHETHAHAAVETALAMISGLDEMNAKFANRGWPEIRLGVGLNTGSMNVGNMGSEFRMAYTVMGDAVNLGSRLEGLTKNYGVDIIVSDSTRAAAPDFAYVQLDRVRVKGRDEPVEIFEPLGLTAELRPQQEAFVREFHEALENYWAQQWNDAEAALDSIASNAGTCPETTRYLPLVRIYLQRISLYQSEPPEPGWDGVFSHKSK